MNERVPSIVRLGIYEKAMVATNDWSAFFAEVGRAGFDFVDLSVDESEQRAARLRSTADWRARVRHAAMDQGVAIGGICLSIHRRVASGSKDPAIRRQALDVYRRGIKLCFDLGVNVLQVAGYFAHYEPDDQPDSRERYVDTLAQALPEAAMAGVILGIENVDGNDLASIPDVMSVVNEFCSPWLQAYPDIGNIAEHGGDATTELQAGEGHMVAMHVKDVKRGQPRRIPFGAGVVDFPGAFAELARQRWSGRMMLEMWNDNDPYSGEISGAARAWIAERLKAAGLEVAERAG